MSEVINDVGSFTYSLTQSDLACSNRIVYTIPMARPSTQRTAHARMQKDNSKLPWLLIGGLVIY